MFFDDSNDYAFADHEKTIQVHKNGHPTISFDLKVKKSYKPDEVVRQMIDNLGLTNIQKFRLFTIEGVEIYPEELEYMKDGDSLFASSGADFDKNSTLTEYQTIRQLGEGGFGSVYLAKHKRSGENVAIKFLKSAHVKAFEVDRLYSEAETLKNLHHRNIVKILSCLALGDMQIAFVMEYLDGGELYQYVKERKRISEEEAREFFIQITEAVAYLHRQKIIHCDLKLENLLLESKDTKVIKVVDFGISGLCSNIETGLDVGSFDYMAPEFFNESMKNLHPGIDIWAMGVILYTMVCGSLPFRTSERKRQIQKICNAEYSYGELDGQLSRGIKDLIKRMLQVDASSRLTIYEVFDHPWMRNEEIEEKVEEKESLPEVDILKSYSVPSSYKNVRASKKSTSISLPGNPKIPMKDAVSPKNTANTLGSFVGSKNQSFMSLSPQTNKASPTSTRASISGSIKSTKPKANNQSFSIVAKKIAS